MKKLMTIQVKIGEVGLELFLLHLLWLGFTLLGGIVLGFYPATMAVIKLLRDNHFRLEKEASLFQRFWYYYRAEFIPANLIGALYTVLYGLLVADYWIISRVNLGNVSLILQGVLLLLLVICTVLFLNSGAIYSHFEGKLTEQVKRSFILLVGKPLISLKLLGIILIIVILYGLIPGLIPVFGLLPLLYFSFKIISKGAFEERVS